MILGRVAVVQVIDAVSPGAAGGPVSTEPATLPSKAVMAARERQAEAMGRLRALEHESEEEFGAALTDFFTACFMRLRLEANAFGPFAEEGSNG
jgi:hypothetical protein